MANDDYGHVAMPKLYGAPAYARPPVSPTAPVERPVDPDDLPLEVEQTDDERALVRELGGALDNGARTADLAMASKGADGPRRRSFGLRAIAGFVRGDRDTTTDAG